MTILDYVQYIHSFTEKPKYCTKSKSGDETGEEEEYLQLKNVIISIQWYFVNLVHYDTTFMTRKLLMYSENYFVALSQILAFLNLLYLITIKKKELL